MQNVRISYLNEICIKYQCFDTFTCINYILKCYIIHSTTTYGVYLINDWHQCSKVRIESGHPEGSVCGPAEEVSPSSSELPTRSPAALLLLYCKMRGAKWTPPKNLVPDTRCGRDSNDTRPDENCDFIYIWGPYTQNSLCTQFYCVFNL